MTRTSIARRILLSGVVIFAAACQDGTGVVAPESAAAARAGQGHTQQDLAAWFERASPAALAVGGAVFADHDEANGRLLFGVEHAGAARGVQTALAAQGIPASAYAVEVVPPIRRMVTLRDVFRPTQAGTQIHYSNYVCTIGFNVDHSGGRSFITNSHCTARQGGTESTQYFQSASNVDPTVIAVEAADPAYGSIAGCPKSRKCRRSDSSRALYSASVLSSRGIIARTDGVNTNSLNVAGTFAITAQDDQTTNFGIGTVVNKVGRTTGWTRGGVTNTCVNTNVSGSNITLLCQTFVSAGVAGGDSGSPVFVDTGANTARLVGILWGGSSDNRTFVFSPLRNIEQELGDVNAVL
ncbi:MAG TPA: hypothetical protein VHG51_14520 [Longimicrobiaceae bacterium]|nr:hypothetical protein [Longimicrobiaceae bacterium]